MVRNTNPIHKQGKNVYIADLILQAIQCIEKTALLSKIFLVPIHFLFPGFGGVKMVNLGDNWRS